MALDSQRLAQQVINKLPNSFDINNQYSQLRPLIEAIADAVIEEITSNAETTPAGATTHAHKIL